MQELVQSASRVRNPAEMDDRVDEVSRARVRIHLINHDDSALKVEDHRTGVWRDTGGRGGKMSSECSQTRRRAEPREKQCLDGERVG